MCFAGKSRVTTVLNVGTRPANRLPSVLQVSVTVRKFAVVPLCGGPFG